MKGIANIRICDKCGEVATYTITTETHNPKKKIKQIDLCDKHDEEYKKLIEKTTRQWLKNKE